MSYRPDIYLNVHELRHYNINYVLLALTVALILDGAEAVIALAVQRYIANMEIIGKNKPSPEAGEYKTIYCGTGQSFTNTYYIHWRSKKKLS